MKPNQDTETLMGEGHAIIQIYGYNSTSARYTIRLEYL